MAASLMKAREFAASLSCRVAMRRQDDQDDAPNRRTGAPKQAQKHAATAITMYGEMKMRFQVKRAETEMHLLRQSSATID
jgi:hypothetical protein